MTGDAELHCRCGAVHGRLTHASPDTVNRMLCFCDDCQAYLHHLGRADLLDAHGGTEIVHVAPASLSFDQGADRIVGLRLTPRGLYRWYASCCKTPVGNTLGPAIPFVGLVVQTLRAGSGSIDDLLGKPVGSNQLKYAVGGVPEGAPGFGVRFVARSGGFILGWRLRGQTWPHPYFDRATRKPKPPVSVLSREERDALRPLCGPRPVAQHRDGHAQGR
jgi:hypothetical protein